MSDKVPVNRSLHSLRPFETRYSEDRYPCPRCGDRAKVIGYDLITGETLMRCTFWPCWHSFAVEVDNHTK